MRVPRSPGRLQLADFDCSSSRPRGVLCRQRPSCGVLLISQRPSSRSIWRRTCWLTSDLWAVAPCARRGAASACSAVACNRCACCCWCWVVGGESSARLWKANVQVGAGDRPFPTQASLAQVLRYTLWCLAVCCAHFRTGEAMELRRDSSEHLVQARILELVQSLFQEIDLWSIVRLFGVLPSAESWCRERRHRTRSLVKHWRRSWQTQSHASSTHAQRVFGRPKCPCTYLCDCVGCRFDGSASPRGVHDVVWVGAAPRASVMRCDMVTRFGALACCALVGDALLVGGLSKARRGIWSCAWSLGV